jgi:uncharacterized protein YkwD
VIVPRFLAGLGLLLGLLGQAPTAAQAEEVTPDQLIEGTNQARRAAGVGPLAEDPLLDAVAIERSREMAATGRLGHVSAGGESVFELLQRRGVSFTDAAENVSWSSGQADRAERLALQSFLESPPHRANLLNPRFRSVGAGLIRVDDETYLALLLVE